MIHFPAWRKFAVICTRGVAGLTGAKLLEQPLGRQLRGFRSACGCLKLPFRSAPLRLRISLLKILLWVASPHVRTRMQLRPSCSIQKTSHSAQVPKASGSLSASLYRPAFALNLLVHLTFKPHQARFREFFSLGVYSCLGTKKFPQAPLQTSPAFFSPNDKSPPHRPAPIDYHGSIITPL